MNTYGTPKSDLVKALIENNLFPIKVTIMLCEEAIIFKSKQEAQKAYELFPYDAWFYSLKDFQKEHKSYVNQFYKNDRINSPKVFDI